MRLRRLLYRITLCLTALCLLPCSALGGEAFTPSRETKCGHTNCYWTTPMDIRDERAVWAMLLSPVTVLKGGQKEQVYLLNQPNGDAVGEITCASQSVHVLGEDQNGWTQVETYSSSFHDSKTKNWNGLARGWVETEKLTTVTPASAFGMVADKLTQRLYVFKEGKLFATLRISTGLSNERQPYNETRSGEFLLVSPVGDFLSDNLLCEKALRFNNGDLLHQVPKIKNSNNYASFEAKLGQRASHGCIRVQRQRTPEGVNMSWLWANYENNLKLVVWEDWPGRVPPPAPAGLMLYHNPKKGRNYHTGEVCYGVRKEYQPMQPLPIDRLFEKPYDKLKPCPYCNPPLRETMQ